MRSTCWGLLVALAWTFACTSAPPGDATNEPEKPCDAWQLPTGVGVLEPAELDEASGLAASRVHPGVYFTHNDSGGTPELFAIDRTGALVGRWEIEGVENRDWEAIASGPCPRSEGACLYIGDTGDNLVAQEHVKLIVVREPAALGESRLEPLSVVEVRYEEGPRDVEALVVDREGDVYLIEKFGTGLEHGVWRVPSAAFSETGVTVGRLTTLTLSRGGDTFITDADLHPTNAWLLVRTYFGVHLFAGTTTLEALEAESLFIEGGEYGFEAQGEAIAWSADGSVFLTTSEGAHAPLSEWRCE